MNMAKRTSNPSASAPHASVSGSSTSSSTISRTGTATILRVAGPIVVSKGEFAMHDIVLVGKERLAGEVIRIDGDNATIQVYEETTGLAPGEPVESTGKPLMAELGPGLLGSIFDGIQRPLSGLAAREGASIGRGIHLNALDRRRAWDFIPSVKRGDAVRPGQAIGSVEEFPGFRHYILIPPDVEGTIDTIKKGAFTVEDTIGTLTYDDGHGRKLLVPLRLMHSWPVRRPRPVVRKRLLDTPLITGQRVIDTLFPIAKGGTAVVSGPFGSGKTVLQQQLAKWSDADIIVYIGCGERGNEMTEVITDMPKLKDPRSGRMLSARTVLVANTSNMPVAARESSLFTGAAIAEYFRDMGYDVALMADSTSRWAEALREIGSRIGEMPGEEGFPAHLGSGIAAFYERAGSVVRLGDPDGRPGSLTIIGAVSPPGGDFFEPVTQASLRVAKVFLALDARIAQQRHFPSVSWLEAYSLYEPALRDWHAQHVGKEWSVLVGKVRALLQEEARLLEIARMVGTDTLPQQQQFTLHAARLVREGLLQQQALDERETFCPLERSYRMMQVLVKYYEAGGAAIASGTAITDLLSRRIDHRIFGLRTAQETFESDANAVGQEISSLSGEVPYGKLLDEETSDGASPDREDGGER
jgi:V/A-type H+-transporting ATPase subunit A